MTLLLLIGLSGCATGHGYYLDKQLVQTDPQKSGYMVVSLGMDPKNVFTSVRLHVRKKMTGDFMLLQYMGDLFADKADFESPQAKGLVATIQLPVGEYEIFKVEASFKSYMSDVYLTSKQDFSLPFTIEVGHTTYLGKYIAQSVFGKNYLGLIVRSSFYYDVSFDQDADIAIAQQKIPSISSTVVKPAYFDFKAANLGFFRLKQP